MALKRTPRRPNRKPMRQQSRKQEQKFLESGWLSNSTFPPRQRSALDQQTRSSARRPQPAVPPDVRDSLKKRAGEGYYCEIQREDCLGQGTDPAHRITTKSGGRKGAAKVAHDRLSDVLWACRACHRWCHDHPAEAKAEDVGWALEEWQNPAREPVLYRGRLVYLDDDGGVHEFEQVGT